MIYIANYATAGDFEAEQDDPSTRGVSLLEGLDMMASPQLASVAMKMTSEWVQSVKDQVEETWTETIDDANCELAYRWETSGWNEVSSADGRRSNQVFKLYEDAFTDGDEPVAMMVIQRVPVSEI